MLGAWLLLFGLADRLASAQAVADKPARREVPLVYWKHRNFRIPINLSADQKSRIKEVILLASDDLGDTWESKSRTDGSHPAFSYRATHDGEFWFTVQTRTTDGKVSPSLDSTVEPKMKVVIDTVAPSLSLEPERRRGSLASVRWEVKDRNLDLRSLFLEYQVEGVGVWNRVPIGNPKLIGSRSWDAGTSEPLKVRMTVSDRAANVTERLIDLPDGTGDAPQSGSAAEEESAPPGMDQVADSGPEAPRIEPGQGFTPIDESPPTIRPATTPRREPAQPRTTAGARKRTPPPAADWDRDPGPPPSRRASASPGNSARGPARTASAGAQDIFPSSEATGSADPAAAGLAPGAEGAGGAAARSGASHAQGVPTPGAGANTLLVNGPRFKLQYAVEDAGPNGPATVEVWATPNGGRKWFRRGEDPDRVSPVEVDLGGEGTYGISLVARSAAGLGDQPPADGEPPRSWVEVDTTPPTVQLDPVQVGTGVNSGKVLITWRATDLHLAARSVALFWRPDEPGAAWQPLSDGQENAGRFTWAVPASVPPRFHIRVEAIDSVGHRGYAETTDSGPIMVDRSRPRSRIIGLDTNARSGMSPSGWPIR